MSKILSVERIVEAAAWLVTNGLYDFHQTIVEMPINPSGVSLNNLTALLKHLEGFFLPTVQQQKKGADYRDDARIDKVLVVVNMENDNASEQTTSFDIIYSNTWGEFFTENYDSPAGVSKIKEYVQGMNRDDTDELTSKVEIHVPESINEMTEKRRFYNALFRA